MKTVSTLLVSCVGLLLALGLLMLYSAGLRPSGTATGAVYWIMQMAWAGVGLMACLTALWLDYRQLKKAAWVLLGLGVVLLVLVLVPGAGVKINGAQRWLDLGIGHFQPSEAAKLFLIIALAWYGERFQSDMPTLWKGVVLPGMFIGLVLGLIYIEPDRGTTILLATICGIMLLVAGARWIYLTPPLVVGAVALAYSLWTDPLRLKRILSWMDPEGSKDGTGHQLWQGLLALGSGGWTGVGLGNGRQKLFVPLQMSDFIFPMIGEELGLIATLMVLLVFVTLVFCGIYIAWNATDTFGFLLGTGITFWIGLQAFINLGVVTGLLPNKGLPLPFISYGGSNLLLMLTCVGILLSIARHSPAGAEEIPEEVGAEEAFASRTPQATPARM